MRAGDVVLAIGNSLGEGIVVTDGIISGVDRRITLETGITLDVMQTNAAINQGNSGGPLINLLGEVIGVNTAKASASMATGSRVAVEGTGYAIPSNIVKQVIRNIMSDETEAVVGNVRPRLGITGGNISEEVAEMFGIPQRGAWVGEVNIDEAAYIAGVRPNDIITAVNGVEIEDFEAMRQIVLSHIPGDILTLTILREGTEVIEIDVVLAAGF